MTVIYILDRCRYWITAGICFFAVLFGGNSVRTEEFPEKVTFHGPVSPGFYPGLGTLPLLGNVRTRSISAENPTGEPGKGGTAIPDPTEKKPAASARAADDLGQGWKVRPFLRVNAGETALSNSTGMGKSWASR